MKNGPNVVPRIRITGKRSKFWGGGCVLNYWTIAKEKNRTTVILDLVLVFLDITSCGFPDPNS